MLTFLAFIMAFFLIFHVPFTNGNLFGFIYKLYTSGIHEITGYLVANAFNLWSLVYGFSPLTKKTLFLGVSAEHVGYLLFFALFGYFVYKLRKISMKSLLFVSFATSFAGFLFLTQMHERYAFLPFLFLCILSGLDNKLRVLLFVFAIIFTLNLYHYWWVPDIPLLVNLFSLNIIEKVLAFLNLLVFVLSLKFFKRNYAEAK